LPNAVRTDFGRCAIVRFLLAAAAAFLMFFPAALRCFVEAICSSIDLGVGRSLDAGGPQLGYSQINGSLYLGEHVAKPSAGPGSCIQKSRERRKAMPYSC
jgi:hypothetical protein